MSRHLQLAEQRAHAVDASRLTAAAHLDEQPLSEGKITERLKEVKKKAVQTWQRQALVEQRDKLKDSTAALLIQFNTTEDEYKRVKLGAKIRAHRTEVAYLNQALDEESNKDMIINKAFREMEENE